MLSATEFWENSFGKPRRDSERFAISMMAEYGEYVRIATTNKLRTIEPITEDEIEEKAGKITDDILKSAKLTRLSNGALTRELDSIFVELIYKIAEMKGGI